MKLTLTPNIQVGDQVMFDHFGATNRLGRVVKITATKLHVQWTAPSSAVTRVVPISLTPSAWGRAHGCPAPYGPTDKNVRVITLSGWEPLTVSEEG
jgi:hypothetical protein